MKPTYFEVMDYAYAIEAHRDFERYGLPYEGGSMDQPWEWKIAVDAVNDALTAAKVEAMADAKEKRESQP